MVALAAISFGSVYAHSTPVKASTLQDTVKKKKMKPMKKDSTKKKDTTKTQK